MEQKEFMDIVKAQGVNAIQHEEVKEYLTMIHRYAEYFKEFEKSWKDQLKKAMKETNTQSVDNDLFKATIVKPSVRKTFATDNFKTDFPELYEEYVIDIPVDASLRVKWKK